MRRFLPFVLSLVACGGSTATSNAPADSGSDAPPRVPKVHRASAAACPSTREPGQAAALPGSDNKCTKDEECTAGKNGRCWGGLQPNACNYDECTVDGECKSGVCDCRNVGTIGRPNRCFAGNCKVDADCDAGKGYCSPSATTLAAGCTGFGIGSIGYFCHTPQDACVDDEDCKDPITRCLFDPEVLHWKCTKVLCPR